jgi:hypothetical protein
MMDSQSTKEEAMSDKKPPIKINPIRKLAAWAAIRVDPDWCACEIVDNCMLEFTVVKGEPDSNGRRKWSVVGTISLELMELIADDPVMGSQILANRILQMQKNASEI